MSKLFERTVSSPHDLMARATGREPAASCVTGRRSNQLNYAPAWDKPPYYCALRCRLAPSSVFQFPAVPSGRAVTEQQIYVFPMTWRTTTALKAIEILEPNRWCVSRYTVPQIRVGDRHIPADISTEL